MFLLNHTNAFLYVSHKFTHYHNNVTLQEVITINSRINFFPFTYYPFTRRPQCLLTLRFSSTIGMSFDTSRTMSCGNWMHPSRIHCNYCVTSYVNWQGHFRLCADIILMLELWFRPGYYWSDLTLLALCTVWMMQYSLNHNLMVLTLNQVWERWMITAMLFVPIDWATNDWPVQPCSRSLRGWWELWYWSLHQSLWSFQRMRDLQVTENLSDQKIDFEGPLSKWKFLL